MEFTVGQLHDLDLEVMGCINGDTIYWKQMVVSNTNIVVDTVDVTFKLNMANVTDPFTT